MPLPVLYVEGADDVGLINALLKRHGVDTESGKAHLHMWRFSPAGRLFEIVCTSCRCMFRRIVRKAVSLTVCPIIRVSLASG